MSDYIVDVINSIPNVEKFSYLELGTGNGINFKNIKCLLKKSVDINNNSTYKMTTDNFFKQNTERFDIIFIDANHNYDYLVRDYNNSIKICNKFIFIHDLFPAFLEQTKEIYCSDSYKILYNMVKNLNFDIKCLNTDSGLSYLKKPFTEININNLDLTIDYNNFIIKMNDFKRYTLEEFKDILKKDIY